MMASVASITSGIASTAWARAAFAAIVLVLSLAAPVAAGPLEDAAVAYSTGDYATALRLFRPLADQGVASAQAHLGSMYYEGKGVPQDYAEAVKWYRLAADQGEVLAQHNLGSMYYDGKGVPQDYAEAVKWYRLAADQGEVLAQDTLGDMYKNGHGVPQDFVSAHMWYNLSAAQGYKDAADSRNEIAKRMTSAQIAEAQKLAREWKPKRP
jgi:TPR repeat protein